MALRRHLLGLVGLLTALVITAPAQAAAPARVSGTLTLHFRRVAADAGVRVSGRYAWLDENGLSFGEHVLIDDRTGVRTVVTEPHGCAGLWGDGFGSPWALFYCGGPRLYDLVTHAWRPLPCATACENIGTAAPQAIGRYWVAINEDAYCDERLGPCNAGIVYVRIPDGAERRYRPITTAVVDLNSRSLVHKLCSPLHMPANGLLTVDGRFAVRQDATGAYVERCGSRARLMLARMPSGAALTSTQTTPHALVTCALDSGRYSGVWLPSLRRFTFTLPRGFAPCSAAIGDYRVYARDGADVWAAPFPG